MGAKLIIQPTAAEPFEVTVGNTVTIGRTRENSVCLNFSPLVSRQHAIIRCHNGYQYQLIDLGSRNGTYVDDQRVIMPVALTSETRNGALAVTPRQARSKAKTAQRIATAQQTRESLIWAGQRAKAESPAAQAASGRRYGNLRFR